MKSNSSIRFVSFFISVKGKDASLPVTEEVVAEAKSECYSSIKSKDTVTMDFKSIKIYQL
jgi:hypothetical protein